MRTRDASLRTRVVTLHVRASARYGNATAEVTLNTQYLAPPSKNVSDDFADIYYMHL